ncbi:MAG: purine-binding chemotaxis protein CheW [Planctomycetales bacterium]|nr:purine-binding chemotaxis protein CheW [bacterium]UNM08330.1 MAG: purine-binding chemotaxis protein CheW [Planctomycetales bacterium]
MKNEATAVQVQSEIPELQAVDIEELLVVCRLGGQEFGLFANIVTEIIAIKQFTRVPNSSDCIDGVINLRGRIIPVFNLRTRLGMPEVGQDQYDNQSLMVVDSDGDDASLLVDQVADVIKISTRDIDDSAAKLGRNGSDGLVSGTVTIDNRLITLLNLAGLLGTEHPEKGRA